MTGLNLGVGGGLRLGGVPQSAQPATLAQTAYGAGSAPSSPSGIQTHHVAAAVPAIALAWLAWVRYSLPAGDKHRFDMSTMVVVGILGVVGGLRIVAGRHIAEGSQSQGWQAVKVFTG